MEPGVVASATGLLRGSVIRSLRQGTAGNRQNVEATQFRGFDGFWGLGPSDEEGLVVLTDRPTDSGYPNRVLEPLMRRLGALGVKDAHLTNLNKRRGGAVGDGEDLSFHLAILVTELVIVGRGRARLVVAPNLSWARMVDPLLARLQVELAARLPMTEVIVLRSALGASPCEPPRALYGQWAGNDKEEAVMASWREVISTCLPRLAAGAGGGPC